LFKSHGINQIDGENEQKLSKSRLKVTTQQQTQFSLIKFAVCCCVVTFSLLLLSFCSFSPSI
jgi:hypothetical protein